MLKIETVTLGMLTELKYIGHESLYAVVNIYDKNDNLYHFQSAKKMGRGGSKVRFILQRLKIFARVINQQNYTKPFFGTDRHVNYH